MELSVLLNELYSIQQNERSNVKAKKEEILLFLKRSIRKGKKGDRRRWKN